MGLGPAGQVEATLTGLSHTFAADLDIQLVSPAGTSVTLLSDTAAGNDFVNATIHFDDEAAGGVPSVNPIPSGTDQPSGTGVGTPPRRRPRRCPAARC